MDKRLVRKPENQRSNHPRRRRQRRQDFLEFSAWLIRTSVGSDSISELFHIVGMGGGWKSKRSPMFRIPFSSERSRLGTTASAFLAAVAAGDLSLASLAPHMGRSSRLEAPSARPGTSVDRLVQSVIQLPIPDSVLSGLQRQDCRQAPVIVFRRQQFSF